MFDSKKKEMLENLKNDKEYIDELKILNELLKYDKCVVPSKEFNGDCPIQDNIVFIASNFVVILSPQKKG